MANEKITVKIGAFNVAVGEFGTAEDIGNELAKHDFDVVGINECPRLIDSESNDIEWIEIVAKKMNMKYYEIGCVSSGNHWSDNWGTDITKKYHGKLKGFISKNPIKNTSDTEVFGNGWSGGSVFRGETTIKGLDFAFYSLHIPGSGDDVDNSTHKDLADRIIADEDYKNYILTGDFNDSATNGTMQYLVKNGMKLMTDIPNLDQSEQSIYKMDTSELDHILCKTPLQTNVLGWGRINPKLSDHPYIWSEFELLR